MANPSHILVSTGLLPVHSFDLYGPLVDSEKLCEQNIRFFEQIASQDNISPENAAKIVSDYMALSRGELWATGELKIPIINALYHHLKKYLDLQPDYQAALQEDGLSVLREILGAGEGVLIFTSIAPDWLKGALPEDLGSKINHYPGIGPEAEKMINVYAGRKTNPQEFVRVHRSELHQNRVMITHTADELPELEAAFSSGLFSRRNDGKLIFINRNGQISPEQARSAGIDFYVQDLKKVGYTHLVKK